MGYAAPVDHLRDQSKPVRMRLSSQSHRMGQLSRLADTATTFTSGTTNSPRSPRLWWATTTVIAALAFREADGALISAGFDSKNMDVGRSSRRGQRFAGQPAKCSPASTSPFESLAVCQSGKAAYTGDSDGDILMWDTSSTIASRIGRPLLKGHSAPITAMKCSEDSHSLLSADEAGVVRLWDLTNGGREVGQLGRGAPAHAGAVVPAGGQFLVGTDTGMNVRG